MRPRRLLIASATALPAAAGSAVADAKRLSALEVRHGELAADRQNRPGPEVAWQNGATREQSTKDGLRSCGD
ncbi:hypothetical protein GCM10011609_17580 [Lentzea pudingi]|uniref:Secreted protein n=1 Tax=Lentzea pudingi TaxID=1789439 RepID=A0ABQ2HHR1_9PSEU|nr:hypothetical protein [Lentzea pudingi]GGM82107.1 hypothetical protein GCM10011609_17580 [Lentzea pudingi]